jgi:hypothetical protein
VVDVVREADGDAARAGIRQRPLQRFGERRRQVEVVDGDVERPARGAEEVGQQVRDVLGGLAAVGQRADFDRSSALWARFAAW